MEGFLWFGVLAYAVPVCFLMAKLIDFVLKKARGSSERVVHANPARPLVSIRSWGHALK